VSSGADQHLLALLRAIRLRQAAPDAVAAGVSDTAAALTELGRRAASDSEEGSRAQGSPDDLSRGEGHGADLSRDDLSRGEGHGADLSRQDGRREDGRDGEGRADGSRWGESHGRRWTAGEHGTPGEPRKLPAVPSGEAGVPAVRPRWAAVDRSINADDRDETVAGAEEMIWVPATDFFGRPKRAGQTGPAESRGADAEPKTGELELPTEIDEVGRPSRNLFAGLTPVRKQPPSPMPEEPGPIPERPPWAKGEPQHGGSQGHRVPTPEMPHVAPGRRRYAEADGMDPADDALLRETQRLLSTSLTFAGGPDEVAARFREALLQAHPTLIAALPGGEPTQTELLSRGITWLVHHLDRPPVLVDGCAKLGAALDACGVSPDELRMVGPALAQAIRAGMPPGAWRQDFDLAWRSTWQHAYEWIRHGELTHATETGIWDAVVVDHDLRRHDLAVVRFRPLLPMPYEPGQYARIEVPELPGIWRPYSLAGAPRRNDVIELHVRAKTQTGVSGTLVYRTQEGDRVRFGRAEGSMTLPESRRDLLMIAGDTGVAPLKALLTELADTGDPRSAVLFWGVRNLDELYDVDALTQLARTARRTTVVPVVSEGNPGPYASGLVTDAVAAYGEWSDHEVFLSGPPAMLASTKAALQLLGVSPERIRHDAPE
jgi:NAD(P)H-flavin reductase/hemoglobin-like flavoprotein